MHLDSSKRVLKLLQGGKAMSDSLKIREIGKILTHLAEYYDKVLSPIQIKMYSSDLADLEPRELIHAVQLYRMDARNTKFPLPAILRASLYPSDQDQARDIVAKVIEALSKFGTDRSSMDRAKVFLGELGWLLVKRLGGWERLGHLSYDDINPTAQAQWRELAIVLMKKSRLGELDLAIALPEEVGKPVISFEGNFMSIEVTSKAQ